MRALLYVSAAAVALYGGYWYVGSRAALNAVTTALDGMKAEGTADYAAVGLVGFPSRFDLTVDEPRLVSADGRLQWRAPFLQVFTLAYRPNHIIAVWPNEQTVAVDGETIAIQTEDMRASAIFGLSAAAPLDHMALVAEEARLEASSGWAAQVAEARFHSRLGNGENVHEFGLELLGVVPAIPGLLPPAFDAPDARPGTLKADAILGFTAPLDRFAADSGVRPRTISLRSLTAGWGPVGVTAQGDLTVGPSGYPEGRIETEITGWRELLALLAATGAIDPALAPSIANGLGAVAEGAGDPGVLRLPLVFAEGYVSLGALPLGPAPRFAGYLR